MTDHELHTELLRLLRDGMPEPAPAEFDDETGFLPLGVDVDGDVGVVTFLSREPLGLFVFGTTFHRRNGEWMELGGGGGSAPERPLTRRTVSELGGHLMTYGTGKSVRNADRLLPWGAKWVSQARLQVSAEVTRLRVGSRSMNVPAHGHAVVVWGARRAPVIEALADDGSLLASLDLGQPLGALPSTA
ncbi:hypothetical protein SMC26_02575 [Actinomadura fulvescens]|uniref:Immunity protein 35 domain-containing protein n=1 Tax=Actinomadura fulvescens TaxID=46160 RepID=A0ABN3PGI4_9ACTN